MASILCLASSTTDASNKYRPVFLGNKCSCSLVVSKSNRNDQHHQCHRAACLALGRVFVLTAHDYSQQKHGKESSTSWVSNSGTAGNMPTAPLRSRHLGQTHSQVWRRRYCRTALEKQLINVTYCRREMKDIVCRRTDTRAAGAS